MTNDTTLTDPTPAPAREGSLARPTMVYFGALDGMPDPPHRAKVLLRVELEPVVDVAVEVHGELRHPRHAAVDVDKAMAAVVHRERAGDAQVAIEPRVVEDPAVDLDVELLPADVAVVGAGLDAQARRVGMGAG